MYSGVAIVGVIVQNIIEKTMSIEPIDAFTLMLMVFSLIISYVRPCKLTIANLSLNYHSMVIGLLSWHEHHLSISEEKLGNIFIITLVTSHILVFMWAGYTLTHWIMSHFGYQFNPRDCKAALTDLVNVVKRQFNRRRGSYQVLSDATIQ